jgi:hypothetical protein
MNKEILLGVIRNLLNGFNSEHGCPESVYNATADLIQAVYGLEGANRFSRMLDSADGMVYMPNERAQKGIDIFMQWMASETIHININEVTHG